MTYFRAPALASSLLVTYEWIGDQGQHFIKEKQGKKVGGECDTHGCGKGQSKTRKVTRLRVLFKRPHVPDGVERGQNPKQRCPRGKEQTERIGSKGQFDARKNLEQNASRRTAGQDVRQHGDDNTKHRDAGCNRPEFPQISATLSRPRNQERAGGGDKNSE